MTTFRPNYHCSGRASRITPPVEFHIWLSVALASSVLLWRWGRWMKLLYFGGAKETGFRPLPPPFPPHVSLQAKLAVSSG